MEKEKIDHINRLLGYSFLTVSDIVLELKHDTDAHAYIRKESGERNIYSGIRKLKEIVGGTESDSPYHMGSSRHQTDES